jgi:hypothetical protein
MFGIDLDICDVLIYVPVGCPNGISNGPIAQVGKS